MRQSLARGVLWTWRWRPSSVSTLCNSSSDISTPMCDLMVGLSREPAPPPSTSVSSWLELVFFFFVPFYRDAFGVRDIALHVMSVCIPGLWNLVGFLGLSWCFVPICRRNSYCRWFGIGEDWQHGEELHPLSPILNHSRISPFPPLPPMRVILHLKWVKS